MIIDRLSRTVEQSIKEEIYIIVFMNKILAFCSQIAMQGRPTNSCANCLFNQTDQMLCQSNKTSKNKFIMELTPTCQ